MFFHKNNITCNSLRLTSAIAFLFAATTASAIECKYAVSNDWGNGFTASITVTNNSTSTINSWSAQWQHNGGSTITSSWNATVSGNNPYTARNVEWNGKIAPGASQSFGVQGNGDNSTANILSCVADGGTQSSTPISSAAKSSAPVSSVPASSRAPSSSVISSIKSSVLSSVIVQSSRSSSSSITDSSITLEENAAGFCGVEGTIDSNHTGYRGAGFANAENATGKGIDYAINAAVSGTYQIKFRYANGGAARSANLLVNGASIANITFNAGAWTTWVDTASITVNLKEGNNLLRLHATDINGLANIDSLQISGNRPTAGKCASSGAVTLWIAGDSTVANGGSACAFGWGRDFATHFNSNVSVQNLAIGGRSVRTWLYDVQSTLGSDGECALTTDTSGKPVLQSRWQTMLAGMKSGDYLFIQFGINDGDSSCPRHVGSNAFMQEYRMMAEAARARGATPIFITPVSAIRCSGNTAVASRGFLSETINLGASMNVPVIDLHQRSIQLYNQRGFCPIPGGGTVSATTGGAVGAFFCDDHTHFDLGGAKDIASLVVQGIRDLNLPLTQQLKVNTSQTVNVFLAGDSIVQNYTDTASPNDQAGWGQMLPQQYTSNVIIHNHAAGGRSARRFIDEGRLNTIWAQAKAGDYLLVQFGTNDGHKTATYTINGQTIPYYLEPGTDFKSYLSQYITGARARGINLAFVTPTPRNSAYCTGGNGTGAWAQAMRELAAAEAIPLIDLNQKTVNYLKAICPAPTPENFFFLRSDGSVDGTHFQENGARNLARFVADGIAETGMMLNSYRK